MNQKLSIFSWTPITLKIQYMLSVSIISLSSTLLLWMSDLNLMVIGVPTFPYASKIPWAGSIYNYW